MLTMKKRLWALMLPVLFAGCQSGVVTTVMTVPNWTEYRIGDDLSGFQGILAATPDGPAVRFSEGGAIAPKSIVSRLINDQWVSVNFTSEAKNAGNDGTDLAWIKGQLVASDGWADGQVYALSTSGTWETSGIPQSYLHGFAVGDEYGKFDLDTGGIRWCVWDDAANDWKTSVTVTTDSNCTNVGPDPHRGCSWRNRPAYCYYNSDTQAFKLSALTDSGWSTTDIPADPGAQIAGQIADVNTLYMAIVTTDFTLKVLSNDGNGWSQTVIDTEVPRSDICMLMVDGRPAIAYGKGADGIYARYNGSEWKREAFCGQHAQVCQVHSAVVIDGRPVIAYGYYSGLFGGWMSNPIQAEVFAFMAHRGSPLYISMRNADAAQP